MIKIDIPGTPRTGTDGQFQVQTKLYKSDDPECCPSVIQVDVYRVDGSSEAGTIELLAD
jgi:hypothetical protein